MSEEFSPLDEQEIMRVAYNSLGSDLDLSSNGFEFFPLTAEQLKAAIKRRVRVSDQTRNQLFTEGADCQVMKFGAKGWKQGKIKVKMTVEFCPDEPEEPETPEKSQAEKSDPDSLDDLRKELNQ